MLICLLVGWADGMGFFFFPLGMGGYRAYFNLHHHRPMGEQRDRGARREEREGGIHPTGLGLNPTFGSSPPPPPPPPNHADIGLYGSAHICVSEARL